MAERKTLTAKERAFVNYYVSCLSARKALLLAGYSEGQAAQSTKFLKRPHITEAVEVAMRESQMSKDELLSRLSDLARNKAQEYLLPDGTYDLDAMRRDGVTWLLRGVRKNQSGSVIVTTADPAPYLLALAKAHGVLQPNDDEDADGQPRTFRVVWENGSPVSDTSSSPAVLPESEE